MRLWDVNVKPRGGSRPRGLSVNNWLGKADLRRPCSCDPGMLPYNPETILSLVICR
jgi:hypothetical protein